MTETPQIEFLQKELADLRLGAETVVNPNTGAASISVPIPLTSGRNGFGPQLALGYSSGSGNSTYGQGWNLSGLSSISIDTKNGFPNYNKTDSFVFNGSQLIPYINEGKPWVREENEYTIQYFRNRFEQSFDRIELWEHKNGNRHWVVRSPDNSITVCGKNKEAQLYNPDQPEHIFSWLVEAQYDQDGNAIIYKYESENIQGVDKTHIYEINRFKNRNPLAQRYLKSIKYGNAQALYFADTIPQNMEWHFEVVLDYGEHHELPKEAYATSKPWSVRKDPYSSFGMGFEKRTWRLCHRILQFHHFKEADFGDKVLISVTKLNYLELAEGTILKGVGYTGYRKDNGVYWSEKTPALRFDYEKPVIGESFVTPSTDLGLENMPYGLGDGNYKMVDLYGEGVPGILFESEKAWFYKPNLGGGHFGKLETILEKPSHQIGSYAISDFDNNGNTNVIALQGSKAGYYEYDRDQENWSTFQTFPEAPSIEHGSQLMDINGDGKAELVVFKEDRLTYYPSKGKEGFGAAVELYRTFDNGVSHIPTLGDNLQLDYFTADMTGDGIPNQVRVLNGSVEYWSHLGNGKYTEGTLMGNAPMLEEGFQFDASRIRLVDLTGSGTSDLLYIGRGEIRYWINANGNHFVNPGHIEGLPYIDNFASLQIADFLGNGTPCLVWSSALPGHSHAPIQYLPLTGVKPAGLINRIENGMGLEIQLNYQYSAEFYLKDKKEGKEWITHLPSHSYIVQEQKVIDHIGKTTVTSQYRYHDGYYDGEEREFRGFGFVEQFDANTIQEDHIGNDLPTAEVACIRSWFHSGAYGWEEKQKQRYYRKGNTDFELPTPTIEAIENTSSAAFGDALRALAGQPIRTEMYDASQVHLETAVPYSIEQQNYQIRQLQPPSEEQKGCFIAFAKEQLQCNYEKEASNPLVNHSLVMTFDTYGMPTQQFQIGYPNYQAPDHIHGQPNPQKTLHITFSDQSILHIDENDRYELGIPIAAKSYEIKNIPYTDTQLFAIDNSELLAITENPSTQKEQLKTWEQYYYWNDDQSNQVPIGSVGQKTLLHHQEVFVGHKKLFETIFEAKTDVETLLSEGKYRIDGNDNCWKPSETITYLRASEFYVAQQIISPNAEKGTLNLYYDPYFVQLQKMEDPLGFTTKALIDYHTIAPKQIIDLNENTTAVAYDPLGMIRVTTSYGNIELDTTTGLQAYGNNTLDNYDSSVFTNTNKEAMLSRPENFLQEASSLYYYNLWHWQDNQQPIQSISLIREQFIHNGTGAQQLETPIQTLIAYQDGFGREIQTLQKVEKGQAIVSINAQEMPVYEHRDVRWLVSGHTVFNQKQEPVRQYEPFYFYQPEFIALPVLREFGEATTQFYDALGRTIKTEFPNLTYAKTEINAWQIAQYDPNDTLANNDLYPLLYANSTPEEQTALKKAKEHADTPTVVHLDALGREVLVEEMDTKNGARVSVTYFDFYDNPLRIIDPRGVTAFEYLYDHAGSLLYEKSMDAGEKWTFQNVADLPLYFWDGIGLKQSFIYDLYDRLNQIVADGLTGYNQKVVERMQYGKDLAHTNANGQLIKHYDQAGLQAYQIFSPTGVPLQSYRQLAKDYTTEPNWKSISEQVLNQLLADELFTSTYQIDALDRVMQEQLPDAMTRKYAYHLSGGMQSLKVSTLDGQWQEKDILSDTLYNAKGQKEKLTLGNGVQTSYKYNTKTFRLQRMHSYGRSQSLQDLHYTYDPVGNITQVHNRVDLSDRSPLPFINTYTYDAHNQLITAEGILHQALFQSNAVNANTNHQIYQKGTEHISVNNAMLMEKYTRNYQYDLSGNRLEMKHQSASANVVHKNTIDTVSNRSLSANTTSTNFNEHFDAHGNRIQLEHLRDIQWNYRNNIASATVIERANQADDIEHYQYGADGMRVQKVTQSLGANGTLHTEEKIYLNGCEIKRKREGSILKLDRTTSHFKDGETALASAYFWTKGGNEATDEDLKTQYTLSDHLGSATVTLDEQQALIGFETYFPFGGTAYAIGDNAKGAGYKIHRFMNKERDDLTGLYYYGYRYYAPWIGNWMSPDPIGPEDGLNVYQFVQNNPMNFVDLEGLQSTDVKWIDVIPKEFSSPDKRQEAESKANASGLTISGHIEDEQGRKGFRLDFISRKPSTDINGLESTANGRGGGGNAAGTIDLESLVGNSSGNTQVSNGYLENLPDSSFDKGTGILEGLEDEITGKKSSILPTSSTEPSFKNENSEGVSSKIAAEDNTIGNEDGSGTKATQSDSNQTPNNNNTYQPKYSPPEGFGFEVDMTDSELKARDGILDDIVTASRATGDFLLGSVEGLLGIVGISVSDASNAYEQNGGGLQGTLAAIDKANPFSKVREESLAAYEQNGGGVQGTLAAIDKANPFSKTRDEIVNAYDHNGGGVQGTLAAIDKANPLSEIRDQSLVTYNQNGGGVQGTLAAIDKANPFSEIREGSISTIESLSDGDFRSAGNSFSVTGFQVAAVIGGIKGVRVKKTRLTKKSLKWTEYLVNAAKFEGVAWRKNDLIVMPFKGVGHRLANKLGFLRNNLKYFRKLKEKNPHYFSEDNIKFMKKGKAPIADETWINSHPEHKNFENEVLEHHHIDGGGLTIGLPKTLHRGKGINKINH